METEEGRKFSFLHPFDKILETSEKRELVQLICGILLSQNVKIGKSEVAVLADSIPKTYTKEKSDIYFNGSSGLLYNKAVNLTYKFKEKGLTKVPPKKNSNKPRQPLLQISNSQPMNVCPMNM